MIVVVISTSFDSVLLSNMGTTPWAAPQLPPPSPAPNHTICIGWESPPNFSVRNLHQGLHLRLWMWHPSGIGQHMGQMQSFHSCCILYTHYLCCWELHRMLLRTLHTQQAGLWCHMEHFSSMEKYNSVPLLARHKLGCMGPEAAQFGYRTSYSSSPILILWLLPWMLNTSWGIYS